MEERHDNGKSDAMLSATLERVCHDGAKDIRGTAAGPHTLACLSSGESVSFVFDFLKISEWPQNYLTKYNLSMSLAWKLQAQQML